MYVVVTQWRWWVLAGLALVCIGACSKPPHVVRLSGPSMGTVWNVTVADPGPAEPEALRALIQDSLDEVESAMSTWRDDSELSRLNRAPTGVELPVSPELAAVLERAQAIWRATGGAFDVTVGPLVRLWGFGPDAGQGAPDPAEQHVVQARVGMQYLRLDSDVPAVVRLRDVEVDLSAIAKGYGVDQVAAALAARGHTRFLVEVGGEVRVRGLNPDGKPWRLGIERPDSSARSVARRLALTDASVATSGDYRNFIVTDGQRRSHTIDPRTGAPVEHGLASVTVVAGTAMAADGWATALNVLGPEAGLALARERGLAALFIIRTADGFDVRTTQALEPYLLTDS